MTVTPTVAAVAMTATNPMAPVAAMAPVAVVATVLPASDTAVAEQVVAEQATTELAASEQSATPEAVFEEVALTTEDAAVMEAAVEEPAEPGEAAASTTEAAVEAPEEAAEEAAVEVAVEAVATEPPPMMPAFALPAPARLLPVVARRAYYCCLPVVVPWCVCWAPCLPVPLRLRRRRRPLVECQVSSEAWEEGVPYGHPIAPPLQSRGVWYAPAERAAHSTEEAPHGEWGPCAAPWHRCC